MARFSTPHVFQASATATGNGVAMNVRDLATVGVQIEGITTATVTIEGSIDGTTWYAVRMMPVNTGTVATTATADSLVRVPVGALVFLRARISAYTSGTIDVTGLGTRVSAGYLTA